jgi:hypothetical protein
VRSTDQREYRIARPLTVRKGARPYDFVVRCGAKVGVFLLNFGDKPAQAHIYNGFDGLGGGIEVPLLVGVGVYPLEAVVDAVGQGDVDVGGFVACDDEGCLKLSDDDAGAEWYIGGSG